MIAAKPDEFISPLEAARRAAEEFADDVAEAYFAAACDVDMRDRPALLRRVIADHVMRMAVAKTAFLAFNLEVRP
ncbi:MAG: hypothetical protein NW215_10520 [Hyphomicrobiales bacterium]|nr:hypothetical protein [Hyphomicrobiales bacterium]